MSVDRLRVAAGQFAATQDLEENLAACERLIDQASAASADLVVLPEFANHLSVYESIDHCRSVAVTLDGSWIGAVRDRARRHEILVSLAVTVPRDDGRITVTNVLIDTDGAIIATADKQTLMGNERAYLSGGTEGSPLAETAFGPVGIYACMDGVTFETPRTFVVRGARLLLNSLNSFALDEASLHIPVRAVENGVYVVAANKVGPLLPSEQVDGFSKALGVPATALDGGGESQVVAPDGRILAKASRDAEELIVADIDLAEVASLELRMGSRRPELYGPLSAEATSTPRADVPTEVPARCVVDEAHVTASADGSASLVVLPELTPLPDRIATGVVVATSVISEGAHVGQLWTADGLLHEQAQLHQTERFETGVLGDELTVASTEFGDIALFVGDDHRYPEAIRLAAIAGAHIAIVLYRPTAAWETELAILERAAENRLCLIACAPEGVRGTMILNPPRDSLWNPERAAPYAGSINTPDQVSLGVNDGVLDGVLHPARALQREISRQTDLVAGRAWQASRYLV